MWRNTLSRISSFFTEVWRYLDEVWCRPFDLVSGYKYSGYNQAYRISTNLIIKLIWSTLNSGPKDHTSYLHTVNYLSRLNSREDKKIALYRIKDDTELE